MIWDLMPDPVCEAAKWQASGAELSSVLAEYFDQPEYLPDKEFIAWDCDVRCCILLYEIFTVSATRRLALTTWKAFRSWKGYWEVIRAARFETIPGSQICC